MLTIRADRLPPAFCLEVPKGDKDGRRLAEELGRVLASRGYLVDRDPQRQGDFEVFTYRRVLLPFPCAGQVPGAGR